MGEYGAAGDFAAMTIGGEDNLLGPFPLLKVGHVTVRLCNYSGSNRLQQIKENKAKRTITLRIFSIDLSFASRVDVHSECI